MYFDVFFMFFDDFGRSQLLGSVIRGCRGAQEPKKIKIAKNGLKHPQTIIECHIKGFGVRTIGIGHHISQFIFTDFRGFWGSFAANMPYEESRAKKKPYFPKSRAPPPLFFQKCQPLKKIDKNSKKNFCPQNGFKMC